MIKYVIPSCVGLTLLIFTACKPKETPPPPVPPVQSEIRQCLKHRCVKDDQCANFSVYFPQLTGGDPAVISAVSNSIRGFILSTVGGNDHLPFEVALDSAGIGFCDQYVKDLQENPTIEVGYDFSLVSSVLVNNPHIITIDMSGSSYAGGAHPGSFSNLATYDLKNKGKVVSVTEMIRDTNAILPMLEKGYKQSKGMAETDNIGDLLFPGTKLAMPQNICIVPEGIRFYYNDYEVAPHAVGPSDILLTWEQLGTLTDKKKWFD